jgi:hypothetical protein
LAQDTINNPFGDWMGVPEKKWADFFPPLKLPLTGLKNGST